MSNNNEIEEIRDEINEIRSFLVKKMADYEIRINRAEDHIDNINKNISILNGNQQSINENIMKADHQIKLAISSLSKMVEAVKIR